jgi:hypothetical protein
MKTWSTIAAILLIAATASAQDPSADRAKRGQAPERREPSSRVQLVAEVYPSTSKTGEPIVLKLRLRNVSREVAGYAEISTEMDYEVFVFREDGSPTLRTPRGRHLAESERRADRRISRTLAPGEEASAELEITNIFDLAHAGTYFARVSHMITPKPQATVAEAALSNAVVFTITD